jgi:putative phosphoserine phosphatase/1-acylglycerol-3-phosphate O-acyltransferase
MLKLVRRDMTAVGKIELKKNLVLGPLFTAAGVVFIDRADAKAAIEAMAPAVQALRQGRSLVIAPEGTRSPTARLGRFKKGAFHMAMQAGVPIVPVVLRNVLDSFPKDATIVRPATIEVVVLPPISTDDWTVESLDDRIAEIRHRYLEILRQDQD